VLLDMIGMGIRALQDQIPLRAQLRVLHARLRLQPRTWIDEVSKKRDHGTPSGSRGGC